MAVEEWRPVPGFAGYEVSSIGRVRSFKRRPEGRLLTPSLDGRGKGYWKVFLVRDGKEYTRAVHRLVGEAFLGPRPAGMETRHLDGNCRNNDVSNLKYGTVSENQRDSVLHGTHPLSLVTECPKGHPYNEMNTYVSPRGSRNCRTCRREWARQRRERLHGERGVA